MNNKKTFNPLSFIGKSDTKRTYSFDDDNDDKSSYKKLKQDVDANLGDDFDDTNTFTNTSANVKPKPKKVKDDVEDFSDEENNNNNATTTNSNTSFKSNTNTQSAHNKPKNTSDDEEVVKWYWKSDSDFVQYDAKFAAKLEHEWQGAKQDVRVDQERFIDIKFMLQRSVIKYDAPSKVRQVKREVVQKSNTFTNKYGNSGTSSGNNNFNTNTNTNTNTNNANKSSVSNNSSKPTYTAQQSKPTNTPKPSNAQPPPKPTVSTSGSNKTSSNSTKNQQDSDSVAKWYWANDKNDFEEYDAKLSAKLEKKYQQKFTNIQIDNERFVDLKAWVQRRYDAPNKIRKIKREGGSSASKQNSGGGGGNTNTKQVKPTNTGSPGKNTNAKPTSSNVKNTKATSNQDDSYVIWLWQEDNDNWAKYDKTTSHALELAHIAWKAGKNTTAEGRVDDERYVDFEHMLQKRFDNPLKKRYVKRQVHLSEAQKAKIEQSRQEALKKLAKNPVASSQPSLLSFWNKSTQSQSQSNQANKPKATSDNTKPNTNYKKPNNIASNDDDGNDTENEENENVSKNKHEDEDDNQNDTTVNDDTNDNIIELSSSEDEEGDDEKTILDKKRQRYACGDDYTTLSQLSTWEVSLFRLKTDSDPDSPFHGNANNEAYNRIVSLWQGDITTLEIAAIVNAAKPSLLGGGGIDGAIHKAAGKGLVKECMLMYEDGCEVGDAKITRGHRLPAQYVIHTVGPVGENSNKLRNCYVSSLDLMKQYQLRTIAFCCVSTGIYGFPNKKAAHVALNTVRDWLDKNGTSGIDRIVFCVFLEKDFEIYSDLMPHYFPPPLAGNDSD